MSDYFNSIIIARMNYLAGIINEKKKAISDAPAGTLRVNYLYGHPYYYHIKESKDTNGIYLNKDQIVTAQSLAQKDYDQKVIKACEKELKHLESIIHTPSKSAEDIYTSLSPARQALVNPIRLPDEEYVAQWLTSKKCELMGFDDSDPVILTAGGYRVRSKSEQMWADAFEEFGVPHYFEPLLYLEGRGWVRPDFAGLNVRRRKEIIVEHFGMMDVFSYSDTNVQKLHDYERNGFVLGDDLLITMETKKYPPDRKSIEELIQKHFL